MKMMLGNNSENLASLYANDKKGGKEEWKISTWGDPHIQTVKTRKPKCCLELIYNIPFRLNTASTANYSNNNYMILTQSDRKIL
jgi:hypothetical protein